MTVTPLYPGQPMSLSLRLYGFLAHMGLTLVLLNYLQGEWRGLRQGPSATYVTVQAP